MVYNIERDEDYTKKVRSLEAGEKIKREDQKIYVRVL